MKIFLILLMSFLSTSAFATSAKYTCPSPDRVTVADYDGTHWILSSEITQAVNGQTNKAKIFTLMPITGCSKPKITKFSQVYVSRYPGGFNLVGCFYYGAQALLTEPTYDPGKNCRVISRESAECDLAA